MREVNFSIPNVNKASVGITTALYDRRALDCTSTLPLINSLNHLAYLTTSSARIRDILTVDGGIERLVCILKAGRVDNYMELWKWNLAFQCTVNIGVRGSEAVRSRIVEADVVPVIATMLNNYIQVSDRIRQKAEEERNARLAEVGKSTRSGSRSNKSGFSSRNGRVDAENRTFRRQAPPEPIDIPVGPGSTFGAAPSTGDLVVSNDVTPTTANFPITSPPDRTSFPHHHHHRHHHRNQDPRHVVGQSRHQIQPLATAVNTVNIGEAGLRPVRDADRLPSMGQYNQGTLSNPESPTTPSAAGQLRTTTVTVRQPSLSNPTPRTPRHRRPSIRHQASTANDAEDNNDSMVSDESGEPEGSGAATGEITPAVEIQDITMEGTEVMAMAVEESVDLSTPTVSEAPDDGTFSITQQSLDPGSEALIAPAGPRLLPINTAGTTPTTLGAALGAGTPRYLLDANRPPITATVIKGCPRDDDVLMALQLLAYVSKYCNLRKYFQETHLVPRLKIGKDMELLDKKDGEEASPEQCCDDSDEEYEEEYLQPDDFNIFPLIERFTMRHHSTDMQYWAGVVMRNLCRKDDSRGGIRQCAYWKCGKWEQFTRQFAKCRRCRRTKYCSKECQKSAWVFHRHWCVAASG